MKIEGNQAGNGNAHVSGRVKRACLARVILAHRKVRIARAMHAADYVSRDYVAHFERAEKGAIKTAVRFSFDLLPFIMKKVQ
jgi:hypothetical protein